MSTDSESNGQCAVRSPAWRRAFLAWATCTGLLSAGCATAPDPGFTLPRPHPALGSGAGPLVISDACVQRRVLVGSNFMVVSASAEVAKTLDRETRKRLERRGFAHAPPTLQTVCGVLFDDANPMKAHADTLDSPTKLAAQPLQMTEGMAVPNADALAWARLLTELHALALEAERVRIADAAAAHKAPSIRLSDAARAFARTMADRHGRRSILFVGLEGNSESGGKLFAQTAALVGVGVVAGALAGPASAAGLTASQNLAINGVGAAAAPFLAHDGWRLIGTLVDIPEGQLRWSRVLQGQADPLVSANLERAATTDPLLRGLMNQPATSWSAPGRAP